MKKRLAIGLAVILLLGIYTYTQRDKPGDLEGQWQAIGYLFLGQYRPFTENKAFREAFGDVQLSVSGDGSFTYHRDFDFHGILKTIELSIEDYPTFLMEPDTYDGTSTQKAAYSGLPFLLVKASETRIVVTEYDPETDKIGDLPLVLEKIS